MKHPLIIVLIFTLLVSFLQWIETALETCKLLIIDHLTTSLGINLLLKINKISLEFTDSEIRLVKLK